MKQALVGYSEHLNLPGNPTLSLEIFKWMDNKYTPQTSAHLIHNGQKLKIRITTLESNPFYKEHNDNGKVYCDSCMEFFAMPFKDDSRYINIEINPIGSAIFSIGASREDRLPLIFEHKSELCIKSSINDSSWAIEFEIPFALIRQIFNKPPYTEITSIQANFYKCGDETAYPHYGMWNEVCNPTPDFHRPEFFGRLLLSRD